MDALIALLTARFLILTDPDREEGANTVEYVLLVVAAIALVAIVVAAVTAFVQSKADQIQ